MSLKLWTAFWRKDESHFQSDVISAAAALSVRKWCIRGHVWSFLHQGSWTRWCWYTKWYDLKTFGLSLSVRRSHARWVTCWRILGPASYFENLSINYVLDSESDALEPKTAGAIHYISTTWLNAVLRSDHHNIRPMHRVLQAMQFSCIVSLHIPTPFVLPDTIQEVSSPPDNPMNLQVQLHKFTLTFEMSSEHISHGLWS